MALATDANISRLQQMFPTVEGDVIAILLNDCGNNVEQCINVLLEMNGEDHAPSSVVLKTEWPTVKQSNNITNKKTQNNTKSKPHGNCKHQKLHSGGQQQTKRWGSGNKTRPPAQHHHHPGAPRKDHEDSKRSCSPAPSEDKKVTPHTSRKKENHHVGGKTNKAEVPSQSKGTVRPPAGDPARSSLQPQVPTSHNQPNPPVIPLPLPPPAPQPSPYSHPPMLNGQQDVRPHPLPGSLPQMSVVFRPNGIPPLGIVPMVPNGITAVRGGITLGSNGPSMVPQRLPHTAVAPGNISHINNVTMTYNGANRPVMSHIPFPISQQHYVQPTPTQSQGNTLRSGSYIPVPVPGTGSGMLESDKTSVLKETGREWMNWNRGGEGVRPIVEKKLILLRGLPGSGKSTLAKEVAGTTGVVYSTDDFFCVDGRYVFDPGKLGEYHELNQNRAKEAMQMEVTPVVIDNTNISSWEMKPYVVVANSLGYKIEIMEVGTPWRWDSVELAKRNGHGVSQEKIEKMMNRYEHNITLETILNSQKPSRDNRRKENSHMTNHMTSTNKKPSHFTRSHKPYNNPTTFPSKSAVSSVVTVAANNQPRTTNTNTPCPPIHLPLSSSSSSSSSSFHVTTTTAMSSQPQSQSYTTSSTSNIGQNPKLSISNTRLSPSATPFSPSFSTLVETKPPPPPPPSSSLGAVVKRETRASTSSHSPAPLLSPETDPLAASLLSSIINDQEDVEEEEKKLAKMSKIWGDGKLSDDTEAHLNREAVWRAGGGGGGGGRGGVWSQATASDGWKIESVNGGAMESSIWNSLRNGRTSESISLDDLIGQPHPCQFGPIGRQTKPSDTKPDECQNTTKTTTTNSSINKQTAIGSTATSHKLNGPNLKNENQTHSTAAGDKLQTMDTLTTQTARKKSSSAEVWVSPEADNWSYNGNTDDMVFHEGEGRNSSSSSVNHKPLPLQPLSPVPTHPSYLKPSAMTNGATVNEPSFEDPAIINFVEKTLSSEVNQQWEEEEEEEESLFALPSCETSPESKNQQHPNSLSLLFPSTHNPGPPPPTSVESVVKDAEATKLVDNMTYSYPNAATAPTDTYFNDISKDLHTLSYNKTTTTDTIPSSTPTLIPDDEDFFPSAFETYPNSTTEEVSKNDVTITSSFRANFNPVPVVNHGSVERSKVRRSLWQTSREEEEEEEEKGSESMSLNSSPMQETNVDTTHVESKLVASPAREDGGVLGEQSHARETHNLKSDLKFLEECFPDLTQHYLQKLLDKSEGNVEDAVSKALVSSPTLPAGNGDIFDWSSLQHGRPWWERMTAMGSSAASVTSESEIEGGGGGGGEKQEVFWLSDDDECMDDAEIARVIQELEEESPGSELTGNTGKREQLEEDDNLVLRLSRSLASQLQQMFGPVDQYLPLTGELRDEDLKVLLSERAAKQIWQKWIDTLEAKKVEIQLSKTSAVSRAVSDPVQSSPDSRPPDRSSSELEQLTDIMYQQSAQELSTKQCKVVLAVCNETLAKKVKLQRLYSQFKSLNRDTINYALYKNNFNFSLAAAELTKYAVCDTTDGNLSSKSSPSSFAATAGRSKGQITTRSPASSKTDKKKKRGKHSKQMKQLTRSKDAATTSTPYKTIEDTSSYDDLRAEAALHAKLRSEAFQKAARARSLKQGEVAQYYAQQGHSHTEKMKEANSRAASLILSRQNDTSSQYLDLHGLHVEEALRALRERIHSVNDEGIVYVITGKGLHSKGEAKIKPAVMKYLSTHNYKFEELPGRLKVKLT